MPRVNILTYQDVTVLLYDNVLNAVVSPMEARKENATIGRQPAGRQRARAPTTGPSTEPFQGEPPSEPPQFPMKFSG